MLPLISVLALLLAMTWLIAWPFVRPTPADSSSAVANPAESIAMQIEPISGIASPSKRPTEPTPDELRALVETAIATRKSELREPSRCPSCQVPTDDADKFCRTCGTRLG